MKNYVVVNTEEEWQDLMKAFEAAEISWHDGEKAKEWAPYGDLPRIVVYNTDRDGFGWQEMWEENYIEGEKKTTIPRFLKKLEIIKLKKELKALPKEEK